LLGGSFPGFSSKINLLRWTEFDPKFNSAAWRSGVARDGRRRSHSGGFAKCPTGIRGLDEVTQGGLPKGRPTLVCGGAGCGKTLLAAEFLAHGALQYNEPGVLMCFEETAEEVVQNTSPLGIDLKGLIRAKKIVIDHVHVEREEIQETGEYDLEGLFIRLNYAIDGIGAKRVALDTAEALFGGLPNPAILRAELRRLFAWLKKKGVTAVITGERGDGTLTRHGLEEYVSDCVIALDNRINDQKATRRLRVVKYRGSSHGSNEYPFLIDESGIFVMPITSIKLEGPSTCERISSGIADLDSMAGGQGFYRGSTVLVSGVAGAGKTTIAASVADAACRRGERCLYFGSEESASQILRNMRSVGIQLEGWVKRGLLRFHNDRPTTLGLEQYLATMHKLTADFDPQLVILDTITDFQAAGTASEAEAMLMRLIDFLKMRNATALFTSLTREGRAGRGETGISSLVDTWLLLTNAELAGERNRRLCILKSRGMAHSNKTHELILDDHGVHIIDRRQAPDGSTNKEIAVPAVAIAETLKTESQPSARNSEFAQEHGRRT
jgi:circadian clock protein KaiC